MHLHITYLHLVSLSSTFPLSSFFTPTQVCLFLCLSSLPPLLLISSTAPSSITPPSYSSVTLIHSLSCTTESSCKCTYFPHPAQATLSLHSKSDTTTSPHHSVTPISSNPLNHYLSSITTLPITPIAVVIIIVIIMIMIMIIIIIITIPPTSDFHH